MRHLLLATVLLAGPAGAADRGPGPRPREWPTVRLVWSDPGRVLPDGFAEIGREVRGVFRPLGVDVAWRRADQRPASGGELNVVFLPRDPARSRNYRDTLGRVMRDKDTALWIYSERVRWALGLAPAVIQVSLRERSDYPRALGRVVAHELVHAIAPDEPHAPRGLMQATLNLALLIGPHAQIEEGCARAFLRHLSVRAAREPEPDR